MAPYLVPIIIFAAVLGLWALKRLLSPGAGRGGIRSVAIFRRTPLTLTDARVKAIVERALGDSPEITLIPTQPREDGAQLFAFIRESRVYGVISVPRPYVNPEAHDEIRATLTDPDAIRGLTEHTGWVSVDFMRGERDLGEINRVICRVIAELIDEEAMLLWDVRHERMSRIDNTTKEILRGPAPMLVFGTEHLDQATVNARAGDEALAAAQAEAQRRWPEFVDGWNARRDDEKCAVKAPFRDGRRVEHMWVEVHSIDQHAVHGEINNDPQHVRNVSIGQRVTIPIPDVEDWLIADPSGRVRGGFSVNALMGRKLG